MDRLRNEEVSGEVGAREKKSDSLNRRVLKRFENVERLSGE